jgi:hypothetical protein
MYETGWWRLVGDQRPGYDEYCWKRVRIKASEDVGPGEPHLPATVDPLYRTYADLKKKKDEAHAPQRLMFDHAVILLAQVHKNRVVDHVLVRHFENHAKLKRAIPICALDKHPAAGRRRGRGADHFFAEGTGWRTRGTTRTGSWPGGR